MTLSDDPVGRWSRQVRLPQIGVEGQEKLAVARVAIVGVGGLGCPAATYLAAAGVGTLGLIDSDAVDLTNIHRQPLFTEADEGRKKVAAAAIRLRELSSRLNVETHALRLTAANAIELLAPYDIVIDGSDNFATRYAVNDACVLLGKPNVHGSVLRFEGRVSLFVPGRGPCYRCLYPEPPPSGFVPTCAEAGILGVLPGVIGSIQATEAIKWICGIGDSLVGRLLIFDLLAMQVQEIKLARNTACALCGENPTITEPMSYPDTCEDEGEGEDALNGEDYDRHDRITPRIVRRRLDAGDHLIILDVREPIEYKISRLPDTILIPLGELTTRWEVELAPCRDEEILVLCHYGIRSGIAADFLRGQGFERVKNIDGGIERWAVEVDPTIPRY
ncbi:MAG TPA: molybdopterin-synthase adenylyltransferase MoeB [Acidobacteriota bacterium]|nr:molybdopterin-synthase adenylyltransferase MoeB [Acidobacteriota bacterium]